MYDLEVKKKIKRFQGQKSTSSILLVTWVFLLIGADASLYDPR